MNKLLLIISLVVATFLTNATNEEGNIPKGLIKGILKDKNDGKAIEYATIALYNSADNKLITGGVTNAEGFFMVNVVPDGQYYIEIKYMGYETHKISDISFKGKKAIVDLGIISLNPDTEVIADVNIYADQSPVKYKIDKKVVNVSQQLSAKGGTALDVLENVPSIKVDIEGNVSLRGSESFTVLIDGRPTALEPSDALKQIPSGAIENIEIITNPSAKFDPDGTAGIVNIVTKKNKLEGVSGVVNLNVGAENSKDNPIKNYGGDFTIDFTKEKFKLYLGADLSQRGGGGTVEYQRIQYATDSRPYDFIANTDGNMVREHKGWGGKLGLDYNISKNDVLGASGRIGYWGMSRGGEKDYIKYQKVGSDTSGTVNTITSDMSERGGLYWEANMNYKHNFNGDTKHYLEMQAIANSRAMEEKTTNKETSLNGTELINKVNSEDGTNLDFRLKADYTRPLIWGGKVEAGAQLRVSGGSDTTSLSDFGVVDPLYSKKTSDVDNIYAGYGTFSGELGKFGFQAGLRSEYTYRKITFNGNDFIIDQPDFFPTLHFSYKLEKEQELMASYTRRIERPRGWFLEPFETYMDAENIRRGNPDLKPEYVNSFDLSYQKRLKQNFFSIDCYYRIVDNKISRTMMPYGNGTTKTLHSFVNAGAEYSLGLETMLNLNYKKWFSTNIMGDLYDYRIEGNVEGEDLEQHSFHYSARMNNSFRITPASRIQLDFMYNSPTVDLQGTSEGFFVTNLALRQDLMKRSLTAVLSVRDVFGGMKHQMTIDTRTMYQYTLFRSNTPMVSLSLSYRINNYNVKRERSNGDNGGGMDDGGMF